MAQEEIDHTVQQQRQRVADAQIRFNRDLKLSIAMTNDPDTANAPINRQMKEVAYRSLETLAYQEDLLHTLLTELKAEGQP